MFTELWDNIGGYFQPSCRRCWGARIAASVMRASARHRRRRRRRLRSKLDPGGVPLFRRQGPNSLLSLRAAAPFVATSRDKRENDGTGNQRKTRPRDAPRPNCRAFPWNASLWAQSWDAMSGAIQGKETQKKERGPSNALILLVGSHTPIGPLIICSSSQLGLHTYLLAMPS